MHDLRWTPMFALFVREIRRFMRVVYQTIATPLISTLLYLLIFGVSIGKEISDIQNYPYIAFLIPGLVMMATLRNAFDNASGSIITSKFVGEMEDFRMVPLSPLQITWANALGSLVRGLTVGAVTYAIGALFYYVSEGDVLPLVHPWITLLFMVMGGLAFANLGLVISMLSDSFDKVNAVNTFILLPLIYLGGVFFSLEQLHPFWKLISQYNPLLYLVNGVRYGILGISDVAVGTSFIIVAVNLVIFNFLAIWSLKKGNYHRW